MTKEMFQRHAPSKQFSPEGKQNYKNFRGICKVDGKDGDSAYIAGEVHNGVGGTRVPIMSAMGGIEGVDNPYGEVVVGKIFTGETLTDVIGTPTLKDHPDPRREKKQKALTKAQQKRSREVEALLQDVGLSKGEAQDEAQEEAQEEPVYKPRKRQVKAKRPAPVYIEEQPEYLQVKIQGKFGSYKGRYSSVTREGNCLILMYPLNESVYSPPVSLDDPVTVTCSGESYRVYYFGIEFSLTAFNTGVQVMLFQEEV
jgi:hypothetical protein